MSKLGINLDKPNLWKSDIIASVDMYNSWFIEFAPKAFRETRLQTTKDVEATLKATNNLRDVRAALLKAHPEVLPTLRMSACPPLAVDRLIGLAKVPRSLVHRMELEKKMPFKMKDAGLDLELNKIGDVIERMADPDIFVWLKRKEPSPSDAEIFRAATIIADRLCGAVANPIIRNAQEKRQLKAIQTWLEGHGYRLLPSTDRGTFQSMPVGSFSLRLNVPVNLGNSTSVKIPMDVVVMRKKTKTPLFIEAKSAGDFTNVNKRRKEESTKMVQLRRTYGKKFDFCLFLCGYFDSGYLGYEAADGIDWIWEHRIDDLGQLT